jgi:peroxiredoxin
METFNVGAHCCCGIVLAADRHLRLVGISARIVLRLEAIEKRLGTRSAAPRRESLERLSIGTPAPDFALPDLAGVRHKLSEYRGKDVLLIFFNPNCGFCTRMAADLAALAGNGGPGQAVPIVVTTGDANENRKLVEQFGIRCLVLLQQQQEVATLYRALGTPMGYRIDPQGRIASELAVGAQPLLQLADLTVGRGSPDPAHSRDSASSETFAEHQNGSVHKRKDEQPDPSLARSRLNRTGLKVGTIAPDFSLPLLAGGELSLAELRGRRVLLVFSDPICGPCDELAPLLQELHLMRPDLAVLVISRRDAEATSAKAAARGLTFPIVMQRQWEISKQYGMFATPIAYLIDEEGIVVDDVAVGVEPILALAQRPAPLYVEAEMSVSAKEAAWTA